MVIRGHGWMLEGSSSYTGRRTSCNALSGWRFHWKHSASFNAGNSLFPECKPGFLKPEREWQQWVLQTASWFSLVTGKHRIPRNIPDNDSIIITNSWWLAHGKDDRK